MYHVEDMFGADDADWAIYRKIVRRLLYHILPKLIFILNQNTAAASSDEEEDLINLQAVEQKLLTHDPTFTTEHTHAALSSQRSALISAFRPQYDEGDIEGEFTFVTRYLPKAYPKSSPNSSHRENTNSPQCRKMAGVRSMVFTKYGGGRLSRSWRGLAKHLVTLLRFRQGEIGQSKYDPFREFAATQWDIHV